MPHVATLYIYYSTDGKTISSTLEERKANSSSSKYAKAIKGVNIGGWMVLSKLLLQVFSTDSMDTKNSTRILPIES